MRVELEELLMTNIIICFLVETARPIAMNVVTAIDSEDVYRLYGERRLAKPNRSFVFFFCEPNKKHTQGVKC